MSIVKPSTAQAERIGTGDREAKVVRIDFAASASVSSPDGATVMVVSGDRLARAGLCAVLEQEPTFLVVEMTDSTADILDAAEAHHPTVVLVDTATADIDAPAVVRSLAACSVAVLVLSSTETDAEIFSCLRAGALGFIRRDSHPDEVRRTVKALVAGKPVLSHRALRRLLADFTSQPDPGLPSPELLDELTPREREVVGLVARGFGTMEIATLLVVSPTTAKTHVSRALYKLRARNRAQLVTLAYESGLVTPRSRPCQPG